MKPLTRRLTIGLRREVLILVPVVLALLVVLSTFTLLSYRRAVRLLGEERQTQAARLAGALAETLAAGALPTATELRRRLPVAERIRLLDTAGRAVLDVGAGAEGDPLAGMGTIAIERPLGIGPDEHTPLHVAGLAPTTWSGRRHLVRVDLPAASLASIQQSLRLLSGVVLATNAALVLLVVFFVRHLISPYERLLEKARQVLPAPADDSDEVQFLVSAFERALAALAEPPADGEGGELAALERALAPSIESGMLLLGPAGEVLTVNPAGAALLGLPGRPGGRGAAERELADHPELLALIHGAIRSGEAIQRREVQILRQGLAQTLGLSVHPLRRDDGTPRAYLVFFADLTESRRRDEEERLTKNLEQIGELAAGIAHELRNSLATFRGYLTLIERRRDDVSLSEYLGEMRRETDHLQRVLEDFLSFARPGSARLETLELGTVLRRAAVDPALEGFPVELDLAAPARFRGDPQLLERAFRNLLHNAAQAERERGGHGPLAVGLASAADGVRIDILDRGPGLPPELLADLQKPFVSGRSGGVGLGLALSRRILDLHGARLELDNRGGGGTRVTVHFPPALPAGVQGPSTGGTSDSPRGRSG